MHCCSIGVQVVVLVDWSGVPVTSRVQVRPNLLQSDRDSVPSQQSTCVAPSHRSWDVDGSHGVSPTQLNTPAELVRHACPLLRQSRETRTLP